MNEKFSKSLLNSAYGITAERETAETEETTDPEVGQFVYDVVIHNFYGCDTYTVRADGLKSATYKALKIMKDESLEEDYYSIDSIRIYEENSDELLKEIIFESAETEETTDPEVGKFVYDVCIHNAYGWDTFTVAGDYVESALYKALKRVEYEYGKEESFSIDLIRIYNVNSNELLKTFEPEDTHIDDIKKFKEKADLNSYGEATETLTVNQFERLTRTLYKSLFKAIGIRETKKIPFIISNNMVFFNYNGLQYKYYPSQCKIFKKCGRKYQRINWKDFADDNLPTGQKQAFGRSPPFTPDIRSTTIQ